MAAATDTTVAPPDARARLAAMRRVRLVDHRDARTGAPVTIVMAGCRVFEVEKIGGAHVATLHIRDNEFLLLAVAATRDAAFAAVADCVARVAHLPVAPWSAETEAAERRAAAMVLAASRRPAPVVAAAPRQPALVAA
jgi:hypothetical protein